MTKKRGPSKPYWEMTLDELRNATKHYDRPVPLSKTKPLTKGERALFERMRRAPSVSVFITRDRQGVWVRLDPEIMRRSMRYASQRKMTLSEVINRSLKGMLAAVD